MRKLLMALLLIGGLWLAGSCQNATAARSEYWTVEYNSNFAGAVLMQFGPGEVRMKFDKLGLTIITKAPQWNAIAYSDTTKSYMDMPYQEWKEKFNSGKFGGHSTKVLKGVIKTQPTGKSKKIQGVKADQVIVNRDGRKICEMWLAASISPPKQVVELMHNMLSVPIDRGLPLTVMKFGEGKGAISVLDTNKLDNKPIPKDVFVMPKGLKKVKDEMALMVDENDLDFMAGTAPKAGAAKGTLGGATGKPGSPASLPPVGGKPGGSVNTKPPGKTGAAH